LSDGHASAGPLGEGVAVIGMACRFPGAQDIPSFWRNLRDGVDAIVVFSDEAVLAAGVPADMLSDPCYVRRGGLLEDVDRFDASFFNCLPRDAAVMDPQQRLFLECAWEALERAGYDPARYPGRIGVFGGVSPSTYRVWNLAQEDDVPVRSMARSQLTLGTDKDFLATRVSYKLNLRGPSMTVQSGCSTSLVAVHVACQALLMHQADMILAGGSSISVPQEAGYRYEEGGILSSDGRCRAFDARASGTVPGNGAGIVLLKRLEDALADGDTIHAVIAGSAMNNDGSDKIGFAAPSIGGQADVIAEAQAVAGFDPRSITYVEANGTGTPLGDPIEIRALTRAFRASTPDIGFCAVGSVKSNIGHLDAAAGVAGLIKTVLALEHGQLPPSLHFERPNPACELDRSPFYVNDRLRDWTATGGPRRAGVSSFGIGGTNVHVVLEQAPAVPAALERRREGDYVLLPLSARSPAALTRLATSLADHLRQHPGHDLADVAYTLQVGRREFEHRKVVVGRDREEVLAALDGASTSMRDIADARDPLSAIGERWLAGGPGEWTRLDSSVRRRRIPLPTYPFERERCWISRTRVPLPPAAPAPPGSITLKDTIAGVWRRSFGLEREIGADENFFELGGQSVMAVSMATELRDLLHARVPLNFLYENPTIDSLTRALAPLPGLEGGGESGQIVVTTPAMQPEPAPTSPDLIPLSPEQEEAWLRSQSAPDSVRNLELVLRLRGELELPGFEFALREIARRHPALGASIVVVDGAPCHRVASDLEVSLQVVDVRHVPEADRESYVRDLLREQLRDTFDPGGAGPRWRALVVRTGTMDHVLAMSFDEVICDGQSRANIANELLELYRAHCARRPAVLPQLTLSLDRFVGQRRDWLSSPAAAEAIRYGFAQLAGARPVPLRGDVPRPSHRTFQGVRLPETVPERLAAELRAFCQREGVTLYMCLLTAFDALLAWYTGQTDIVATTAVFNRQIAGAGNLVGNFTTFVQPRCAWTGDPRYLDLLHHARSITLAAQTHQQLPMVSLLGRLGWDDYRQITPAGQITVQVLYQSTPLGQAWPVRAGGLEIDLVRLHLGRVTGDLGLYTIVSRDVMTSIVEYNTAVFSETTAIKIRADLETVLARIVAQPRAQLSALFSGIDHKLGADQRHGKA
jgi:acyl transferase domain-containing protein